MMLFVSLLLTKFMFVGLEYSILNVYPFVRMLLYLLQKLRKPINMRKKLSSQLRKQ